MSRYARKTSETGIYHVMLRGINRQNIFEDDEDCEKMLQILSDVQAVSECRIFAYCFMQNHCHILLKVETEGLGNVFKRIGARYVYWYNLKYKRVGHLFQDRFKSEVIESDNHFLAALRYIHQNPVKAGVCKNVSDYAWSSYQEYVENRTFIDTAFAFELIDMSNFVEFHQTESSEKFLDYEIKTFQVSDTEAKKIIAEISSCNSITEFQMIVPDDQKAFVRKFKDAGMSIRQINRMTGVSKGIVERA